ncbi:DNA-binding transcriptional regulator, GntR family [Fictibacillus solisalsi]|uniref:DNA-binding transcriptional regulator, GntR family n=1 Tax=Fictibacillus solisalsi TaxID=459525 RepID=A0A1G9ZXX6_9BACL|nr:GntR family transcriptional regulator [Fictibacillus solisalsi]SDN25533.1 DNA-binding transcriptional regulator, GntR family [Fictibacillus solisalsi]
MKSRSFHANPLKVQAYNILKEAIINGLFKKNEVITEKRALEEFNISRTPFREAVQSLETEGWLVSIPYKGTFVSPITKKDIEDVFELRMLVELHIVKKISSTISEKSLEELEGIILLMEKELRMGNEDQFIILDREFHKTLYDLAENKRLISISEQISDLFRRIGVQVIHRKNRGEEVITEHKKIIEGLKKGDAVEAMQIHLEQTKSALEELNEEED